MSCLDAGRLPYPRWAHYLLLGIATQDAPGQEQHLRIKGSGYNTPMIATSTGWVCYLLECSDGTLYCGITNDLDKRLAAHNAGSASKYTRARGPVRLVFAEGCADRSAASKRESEIKSLARSEKLKLCASASVP